MGQERAKNTIGAPEREHHLERRPGSNRCFPSFEGFGQYLRIMYGLPAPALQLLRRGAGVVVRALVVPVDRSVGTRHPTQLRDRVGEGPEALFTHVQGMVGPLALRDIETRADEPGELTLTIERRPVIQKPAIFAVLAA